MTIQDAKSILVVEDDADIRETVALALREAGYRVACAENGEAALAALGRELPRLVLLDLMMPVMDGWEFRGRQRAMPGARDVPVVILSAGGQVEKKAQNLQAAGWLRKPVRLETLLAEVANALEGERPAGARFGPSALPNAGT
jgi:DNA-binding response OmpR family regulator